MAANCDWNKYHSFFVRHIRTQTYHDPKFLKKFPIYLIQKRWCDSFDAFDIDPYEYVDKVISEDRSKGLRY